MTALHCAALEGSVKIAKMLVDAGACLRCFDEEGMTPLHFAAMEGSLDVAQYLFEVGKDLRGHSNTHLGCSVLQISSILYCTYMENYALTSDISALPVFWAL